MRTESKMLCIHGLAGIDGHEDDQYQTSVKSRTGYVQIFGKYHLMWCSKLQTRILLSILEAENQALSQ